MGVGGSHMGFIDKWLEFTKHFGQLHQSQRAMSLPLLTNDGMLGLCDVHYIIGNWVAD